MNNTCPARWRIGLLPALAALLSLSGRASAAPRQPRPVPPPPMKGVVVLFSGQSKQIAQNWLQFGSDRPAEWAFDHGAMVARRGDIMSKQRFSDFWLHVEFMTPYMPEAHGQARGNSGVYLQGRYEIQVLDSYGIADPGSGDCGAVYSESAPLVNACRPPLVWQTYDIFFHMPRLDERTHQAIEPAHVTVLQNGILVQNNVPIVPNGGAMDDRVNEPGPVRLQFHGNRVEYRNIWIVPVPSHGALHY